MPKNDWDQPTLGHYRAQKRDGFGFEVEEAKRGELVRGQGTLGIQQTLTNSRYAFKSCREARTMTWLPMCLGT